MRRTLRALRPLRMATRLPGMRIVIDALAAAVPGIGNVLIVTMLVYVIFGIVGMNLFMGKLWYALRPPLSIPPPPGQRTHRSFVGGGLSRGIFVSCSDLHLQRRAQARAQSRAQRMARSTRSLPLGATVFSRGGSTACTAFAASRMKRPSLR